MGVLYGRYDLMDRLTAYKVRPAPSVSPGKFETGTGNFEGICRVLGAYVWDGNYYALEVTTRLGQVGSGGMVRVGPVHYNTVEEIKRCGEVLG
jgi:selenocysteine lyase/cysteine desulfurase